MIKKWEDLPEFMKTPEVRPYWEVLWGRRKELIIKRVFDFTVASVLTVFLAVPMCIISILIKRDSEGPVLYRQERVTTYGRRFHIHKFRTMVSNADKIGAAVRLVPSCEDIDWTNCHKSLMCSRETCLLWARDRRY